MRKYKDIENKLRLEANLIAPNQLDTIKHKLNIPTNNPSYNKNKLFKYTFAYSFATLLIISTTFVASSFIFNNKINAIESELNDYSYISLSINPSVEIVVDNDKASTKSIRGLNKDGVILTYDEDFVDESIEDTVDDLLETMSKCNMVDDNSTLKINVISIDEETKENITSKVLNSCTNYLNLNNYNDIEIVTSTVSASELNTANKNHISPSKYSLALELSKTTSYSIGTLMNKSVQELNNLYYDIDDKKISNYMSELEDKYNEYISTSMSNEQLMDVIDLYNIAGELLLTIDGYLMQKYNYASHLPIKMFEFGGNSFDWKHFFEGPNGGFYEYKDTNAIKVNPSFERINELSSMFFAPSKDSQVEFVSSSYFTNYFMGYDYTKVVDSIDSLEEYERKIYGFVDTSFKECFANSIYYQREPQWHYDFKRNEHDKPKR